MPEFWNLTLYYFSSHLQGGWAAGHEPEGGVLGADAGDRRAARAVRAEAGGGTPQDGHTVSSPGLPFRRNPEF